MAITVVISPLKAFLTDLVESMNSRQNHLATTINSLIIIVQHAEVLIQIRLEDTVIVLFAPEQLRCF